MRQLHRLTNLKGYGLDAEDGEIGKVEEVYFDDQSWAVRYFVVRTGGWLLGREVLIAPRSVTKVDPENARLAVELTQEKVKKSPPVESEKPVSRHYEETLLRHYEWERYWITDTLTELPKSKAREQPPKGRFAEKPEHPHLRSSDEVSGYSIHALDGDIGHVADFIIDDHTWKIRYFEVDTGNWLPGRRVLVAPAWVSDITWSKHRVSVNLKQELIRAAPAYDPSVLITPDDEMHLYRHYRKESE